MVGGAWNSITIISKFGDLFELRLSLASSMGLEVSCGFVEAQGFSFLVFHFFESNLDLHHA